MGKSYKHIFFDLDRTLWDTEANSSQALHELYLKYALGEKGVASVEVFIREYNVISNHLWEGYGKGEIGKETLRDERFKRALAKYNIVDQELNVSMSNDFTLITPQKNI